MSTYLLDLLPWLIAAGTTAGLASVLVAYRSLRRRYALVLTRAMVLYDHARHCPRAQGMLARSKANAEK